MGRWVIGGGFRKAEFLRLRPQIDTIISKRYRFELPYYPVTRRDIPQLPSDTLVIFTDLEVEGDGIVHMHSEGKGEISTLPLFLSLATESYGLRMGIGLDITAFSGDINLWERDSGGFYNAIVKAKASYSIPMGWEMNVNVRGSMSEDTLWIGRLKGTLSGFQLSLRMGGQTEFHKLGLGVMIEQQFPATIGTLYGNTIYVSGLPEDIYSYSDSLKVDTNNQRVTGDWRMDFIDLPKEMENTTYPIKIPMDTKLCLDVNYPVKNLNLGGWVLASLYEFGLGLGIGSKESLIPWGVRLGAHSKRYKIENFSPPPIWEFYLGNSLEFRGVMVDFGFKIDTAIIALLSLVENSRVSSVGGFWFGINYLF